MILDFIKEFLGLDKDVTIIEDGDYYTPTTQVVKSVKSKGKKQKKRSSTSTVNPALYVVFSVETNGLNPKEHDLLSLTFYRPDTGLLFNKYLPLELNDCVLTTKYNNISEATLQDAKPLTQQDVDFLIERFELDRRTLLYFGSIGEKILRSYFSRHSLLGIDKFNFYDIKRDVISSRYQKGVSKENLYKTFGIKNEANLPESECISEWELYTRFNGKQLLIINCDIYEFTAGDYMVPISYITTYPNFKYHIPSLPKIKARTEIFKIVKMDGKGIKQFGGTTDGIVVENIINTILQTKTVDATRFLIHNKAKLARIGLFVPDSDIVPFPVIDEETRAKNIAQLKRFEETFSRSSPLNRHSMTSKEGTPFNYKASDNVLIRDLYKDSFINSSFYSYKILSSATESEVLGEFDREGFVHITENQQQREKEVNDVISAIKKGILPLINCIKDDIFAGEEIFSQELVINEEQNIIALCDLSSKSAVLEIKATNYRNPKVYAEQLYYEANGRDAFLLQVDWRTLPDELTFVITKFEFEVK